MVVNALQVARISLVRFQSHETRLRPSFIPGVNKVPGYVDSNNFSPKRARGTAVVVKPAAYSVTVTDITTVAAMPAGPGLT